MILVTGATGNVGSTVTGELVAHGVDVRGFVRDPRRADRLGDGVDLAVGDFRDVASIMRAIDGVEAVFLACANGPQQVENETAVIDAAVVAGVGRVVKCSAMDAESGSALPPLDWNGRIEKHLRSSGVPFVVLRPCFYMSNLLAAADLVRETDTLFAPAGHGKVVMVDPRDVAAVAAITLTTSEHEGRTLELTSSEALTFDQVAEELSVATGRTIEFVDVPEEIARETFVATGMPDWLVTHLGLLFGQLREGVLDRQTETVREISVRAPRTFASFAQDNVAVFTG